MLQKQSRSRSNPRGLLRSGSSPPGREVVPPKLRAQVHPPKGRTTYMCTAGHRPSGKILATQRCLEAAANMSTSCMELTENAVACESRATNCPSASGRSTNLKFKMRKKKTAWTTGCAYEMGCAHPCRMGCAHPCVLFTTDTRIYRETPRDTARHPETSRDIPETLPRHPRDTPETPRDIPETSPRHSRDTPRHLRDIPETLPRHRGTAARDTPRHPQIPQDIPETPRVKPRHPKTPGDNPETLPSHHPDKSRDIDTSRPPRATLESTRATHPEIGMTQLIGGIQPPHNLYTSSQIRILSTKSTSGRFIVAKT